MANGAWKILVVDDDEDVHVITHMVLRTINFRGRGLKILDAYNAREAQETLAVNPDTALILLDVVMETPDAGLQLVKTIREELAMNLVRIILRTGQPGHAPETEVMQQYDINDYQNKTELTLNRLKTIIIAGIRAYDSLFAVDTMRRNLELTVKERTQDLEESNAIKDTMFSIIAHDLRGPIGNVKSFLDLLLKKSELPEAADREEYLRILQDNAGATLFLLDNLLSWARSNQQLIQPVLQSADLVPIVQEVLDLLSGQALAKQISLEFQPPGPCPGVLDRYMIALVIRNLVSNAIKFTAVGGRVVVTIELTTETVHVSVNDNGVGIGDARLAEISSAGIKTSTFGTQAEKGSGLGLLLCQDFLHKHGSALEITSQPGLGSSFGFFLGRRFA